MSIDDLSDDEEDVLRALRRMAQIEACYRVPPHLVPAARHLQRKGLVREVPWRGPCPPASGTALELLPTGGILAARLPEADGDAAFRATRASLVTRRRSRGQAIAQRRRHDVPPV